MKAKLIFTVLIFSLCLFVKAQLVIKSDVSQDLYYDTELKDWQVIKNHEDATTFKLSKDMKVFQYTENGVTDDYIIKSFDFNEDQVVFDLIIVDNSNYEYAVKIDGINQFLSMTTNIENIDYMLLYNIIDIINE